MSEQPLIPELIQPLRDQLRQAFADVDRLIIETQAADKTVSDAKEKAQESGEKLDEYQLLEEARESVRETSEWGDAKKAAKGYAAARRKLPEYKHLKQAKKDAAPFAAKLSAAKAAANSISRKLAGDVQA